MSMTKQNIIIKDLEGLNKSISFRTMIAPLEPQIIKSEVVQSEHIIDSDIIIEFLENRTYLPEFDYIGYEVKTVDHINAVYLMINPDPLNFNYVPKNSLVICHHKISTHNNRIYEKMLDQARDSNFNIYNFHLGWDIMEGGIIDSFLFDFGLSHHDFEKVDLTYRDYLIPQLGAIFKKRISMGDIINRLYMMNVQPSIIINPQCKASKIGYIPGGGFVDDMVIEMADLGVDVLISSDHNWVVETIAREVGMTLIEIDHYRSERHGLRTMKNLLENSFSNIPINILENVDGMERAPCDCDS